MRVRYVEWMLSCDCNGFKANITDKLIHLLLEPTWLTNKYLVSLDIRVSEEGLPKQHLYKRRLLFKALRGTTQRCAVTSACRVWLVATVNSLFCCDTRFKH